MSRFDRDTLRVRAVAVSARLSAGLLRRYGPRLPVVLVNEYPKSGGTWFAKMLASATGYPYIDGGLLPPTVACVMRNHWHPRRLYSPAVIVVRDCRDVMVSLFHHRCVNIANVPSLDRAYRHRFGGALDPARIREQLPGFIDIEFSARRHGASVNWAEHALLSLERTARSDAVHIVRFESLLADPAHTLGDSLQRLFGIRFDDDLLSLAVQLNDKRWSALRESLNRYETTFVRQGVAGGWREVFTAEAGEVLDEHAGEAMRALQYIDADGSAWRHDLSAPTYNVPTA